MSSSDANDWNAKQSPPSASGHSQGRVALVKGKQRRRMYALFPVHKVLLVWNSSDLFPFCPEKQTSENRKLSLVHLREIWFC